MSGFISLMVNTPFVDEIDGYKWYLVFIQLMTGLLDLIFYEETIQTMLERFYD